MTYNYTDISLGEFPGEISLIIYSPSCVCRCPWCFNKHLLKKKMLTYKQMKDAIDEHRKFITAVVFTGGEPLLNPNLSKAIKYAKDVGLKIKINTNGLVAQKRDYNWRMPWIDYLNISLKGLYNDYQNIIVEEIYDSLFIGANITEYSFVYSPTIWPDQLLYKFKLFLSKKIASNWHETICCNKWTRPDIFTISQMQTGDCLNPQYNDCKVPNEDECIKAAKLFSDIPRTKLIVETKEFGRKYINIKKL